jgi:hypothetical protein
MIRRNVASQVVYLPAVQDANGAALTSSATIQVAKDGTEASGGGTLAHVANGVWKYTFTQAETDANIVAVILNHASAGQPIVVNLITTAANPQDATAFGISRLDAAVTTRLASASYTAPLDASGTRSAVGLASANLDTQFTNVPGNVRTNLATELARIDVATSTRQASSTFATDTRTAIGLASANLDTQISDIKGAGWTSGDSLKDIKDAVDAVVVDVTVLPLDATVVDRVAGTTINLFTEETPTVAVAVVDGNGNAVDLTSMTLEVVIELRPSTDVVVIANANITKANGSFSFIVPSAVTNAARACKWALRKTTDDSVLVQGDLFVNYAPTAD